MRLWQENDCFRISDFKKSVLLIHLASNTERESSHHKICQKVQLLLASKMQANCFLCFSPKPAGILRFTKRILHMLRNLPVLEIFNYKFDIILPQCKIWGLCLTETFQACNSAHL